MTNSLTWQEQLEALSIVTPITITQDGITTKHRNERVVPYNAVKAIAETAIRNTRESFSGVIHDKDGGIHGEHMAFSRGKYLGRFETKEVAQLNINTYFSHSNPS